MEGWEGMERQALIRWWASIAGEWGSGSVESSGGTSFFFDSRFEKKRECPIA